MIYHRFLSFVFPLLFSALLLVACHRGDHDHNGEGETAKPAAPTGVSATAGDGQVTISWDPVAGAVSYNIYWAITAGVTKTIGAKISGITQTSYTHTSLDDETTYYYVVSTVGVGDESAASSEVSATPFAGVTDTTAPSTSASPPGGTYSSEQLVTLACDDGSGSGCANTYFTTDGSDPTTSSTVYTGPITISQDTELKFFSVDGTGNQEVGKTELYVISTAVLDTTPPITTASPSGGMHSTSQAVTLSVNETATTYYTTDGTTPTTGSTVYTGAIALSESTTLHFFSVDSAGNMETVKTETYIIVTTAPNPPDVSGTSPTNDTTPTWTWTSGGDGGNGIFRYKLDHSDLTYDAVETSNTYYTPVSPLSEGPHTLFVQERNAVGTWSASGSMAITLDITPPTVTSMNPPADAKDLAVDTSISATFSEDMDETTITTSTFMVDNDVTGSVTYNSDTRVATFTPSSVLLMGITYTVTLGTDIKDSAGNALAETFWSFTTLYPPFTSQVQKLLASDGQTEDFFGWTVAIDGDYAIVGADGEDTAAFDAGAAYIFHRDPVTDTWGNGTKIMPFDAQDNDYFGWAVAISGDYAIVGVPGKDEVDIEDDYGAAYIFHRDPVTDAWDSGIKITAPDGEFEDFFGVSVGISGDYAIVGASGKDGVGIDSGVAYIFYHDPATDSWDNVIKIMPSDGLADDYFGVAVAIDGDYAIVGSSGKDEGSMDAGAAYVFNRTGINTWDSGTKIAAFDGDVEDFFGFALDISGDYVVVGAFGDDNAGFESGAAYIFNRTGDNTWDSGTKIVAFDAAVENYFGTSVGISGDFLIVGADWESSEFFHAGAAYVFSRTGDNTWDSGMKITASDVDVEDFFGVSVDISGDYAVVGAWGERTSGLEGGAAYIFK